MKKGQVGTGIVECVKFPNKGIVLTEEVKCIAGMNTPETVQSRVIVKNAMPGQQVKFSVNKIRSGKAEGRLLEVLEKSSLEIDSPCKHFGVCGGCNYQTLPYEEQLKIKEQQVHELLDEVLLSSENNAYVFDGIKGSPQQFAYRNKMEFSFGDEVKDGPLALGMHKRGSFYDVVSVTDCQIIDEDYRKILKCTLSYFREKDVSFYHKMTHVGYLRHLLVRKAAKTEEILIDIITTSQTPPPTICMEQGLMEDFTDVLCKLDLQGRIVGILHTTNDSLSDTIKDDGTRILYGKDFFYEELLGLKFKITPFSFFQTNSLGAEVLYETARDYVRMGLEHNGGLHNDSYRETTAVDAGLHNAENNVTAVTESCLYKTKFDEAAVAETCLHNIGTIYDLYSGTGTIAQLLAPVANRVIGVEIVDEAVIAARENANLNGLHNCNFIAGDVLKILDEIEEKPDFIVLDPPRDGIHPKALEKIIHFGVDHIVYISCKPTSLVRDLEIFTARGYQVRRACAVDMFPGTAHVETVVALHRTNS